MTSSTVWDRARKILRDRLSKDIYERWIAVIEGTSPKDGTLELGVANDFYQSWLEENYLPLIRTAVAAVCDPEPKIVFRVNHTQPAPTAPAPERRRPATAAAKQGPPPGLNPRFTFDNFVVGSSNNFAHAAALAVAQSPARAYNPLFIYGGVGLGKTHLMQAIGHFAVRQGRMRICYQSSETFTNEYIDALQRKSLVQFRNKYRNCDLLMIDDIQFLGGKERMQEEFFHTFNALFDNHRQIVMTCDRPACEIPGLEQRLVSRFEWGLVTQLETPDVETRIAILRKKEEELKLKLPDDVILYLAEHIRSNIRRLEGALIRVASYSSLTHTPVTTESLETLLRDTLDPERRQAPSIESIQRLVAEHFDIRMGDMTSKRRPNAIAFPRQVAMYLSRTMTDSSLPAIGNSFGRNHATVLHACRLVEERIQKDATLRKTVQDLSTRLTSVTG